MPSLGGDFAQNMSYIIYIQLRSLFIATTDVRNSAIRMLNSPVPHKGIIDQEVKSDSRTKGTRTKREISDIPVRTGVMGLPTTS